MCTVQLWQSTMQAVMQVLSSRLHKDEGVAFHHRYIRCANGLSRQRGAFASVGRRTIQVGRRKNSNSAQPSQGWADTPRTSEGSR